MADEQDEQVLGEMHDHEQQARHGDGDGSVEPFFEVGPDDAAEEQLLQRDGDDRRDGKQDAVEGEVGRLADRRLGGVDSDYCESFRD